MAPSWYVEPILNGVRIRCVKTGLLGRKTVLPRAQWVAHEATLPGISLLNFLLDAEDATEDGDAVLVPHDTAASLGEDQAASIGLPPAIPHALELRSTGTIDEPGFNVVSRWLRHGNTPVLLEVEGCIATEGKRRYRIPESLFQLIEAVSIFESTNTDSREARVIHWQPIQKALERATGGGTRSDGYLEDLRIFHAASLSLSAEISREQGITFDPVLFGRAILSKHQEDLFAGDPLADPAFNDDILDDGTTLEGVDTLVDESDALLPGELQQIFLRQRFDRDTACREAYPLKRNTYVYIDPPLRRALDVVKAKQSVSEAERRAFLKNPRQAFSEALDADADSDALRGLFVETQQYADWVNGVGLWQARVLPWLPQSPSSWLPEKIGFTIDGKNIEVLPEKLDEIRSICEKTISEGKLTFDFGDLSDVPATTETLAAIDTLRDVAERIKEVHLEHETLGDSVTSEPDGPPPYAIEIDDNIDQLLSKLGVLSRESTISPDISPKKILETDLFPHQREGFDWLAKTWLMGRPGVLLADDMGLGKTIQTLAFAAWLHANDEAETGGKRGPILIVAPTALLRNWREEHDRHLTGGGIGPIVELYGSGIRAFKAEPKAGRDTVEGHGVLDRERLRRASCILTTYETLANYHISFAGIRYPLVVFDEVQKLKTPTTINTHAAKTLNIDFVVGLTGTPVENNLSELWSIMDRLHPGLLKDLRSFSKTYRADDRPSLELLRDELREGEQSGVAVMLRRMKDTTDLGRALPERKFIPLVREMPDGQARAYGEVVSNAQIERVTSPTRGTMLKALQNMRGISLHPEHPSTALGQPETYESYIRKSARLEAAIEVLDVIRERGEKALVFIEFREMQRTFADILRHRYNLPHLPTIINGQTPSARRQELVTQFQGEPVGTFDVMILAPRAAGIGLNITAANHVVHLSRWWNPAVEDQCNDRAYRIGQDKPVTVYLPIARHPAFGDGSFDVKLDELLSRKRRLSRDLLVPSESESDFEGMFEEVVPG